MSRSDSGEPCPRLRLDENGEDKPTVLTTIRSLQRGSMIAKNLSIPDRQACVDHLTAEGYSVVEIAEILTVSERTVARDRKAIQNANAIERDPKLVEQMVGRLLAEAELAITRMRRVTREKTTSAAVKVEAEHRCYQVFSNMMQSMQRLGYLPSAVQEIRADLTHHIEEPPGYDELQAEIARLEIVLKRTGGGDDTSRRQLGELRDTVARLSVGDQLAQVKERLLEGDQDVQTT